MSPSLGLGADNGTVALEHANLLAVNFLEADAVALARFRVDQHDVGLIDRHVLFNNAAGNAEMRIRTNVLLNDVHAFDDDMVVVFAVDFAAVLVVFVAAALAVVFAVAFVRGVALDDVASFI